MTYISLLLLLTICCYQETVFVNLEVPERNDEFLIYAFENRKNIETGEIVSGYQIVYPNVDTRDENYFHVEIVDKHQVLITMPSLPAVMRHDSVERYAILEALQINCMRCQEMQEITLNDINAEPMRQIRRVRLMFPISMQLIHMDSPVSLELMNETEPFHHQKSHCDEHWHHK